MMNKVELNFKKVSNNKWGAYHELPEEMNWTIARLSNGKFELHFRFDKDSDWIKMGIRDTLKDCIDVCNYHCNCLVVQRANEESLIDSQ